MLLLLLYWRTLLLFRWLTLLLLLRLLLITHCCCWLCFRCCHSLVTVVVDSLFRWRWWVVVNIVVVVVTTVHLLPITLFLTLLLLFLLIVVDVNFIVVLRLSHLLRLETPLLIVVVVVRYVVIDVVVDWRCWFVILFVTLLLVLLPLRCLIPLHCVDGVVVFPFVYQYPLMTRLRCCCYLNRQFGVGSRCPLLIDLTPIWVDRWAFDPNPAASWWVTVMLLICYTLLPWLPRCGTGRTFTVWYLRCCYCRWIYDAGLRCRSPLPLVLLLLCRYVDTFRCVYRIYRAIYPPIVVEPFVGDVDVGVDCRYITLMPICLAPPPVGVVARILRSPRWLPVTVDAISRCHVGFRSLLLRFVTFTFTFTLQTTFILPSDTMFVDAGAIAFAVTFHCVIAIYSRCI